MALAIPEGAVIDTGRQKIVYKETSPGVFDGVAVELGPRCGAYYPVLGGLTSGEHVAAAGSFLIDAETRLNPAAGSIYLTGMGSKGAQGPTSVQPSQAIDDDAVIRSNRSKLNAKDRQLVEAQDFCPINADTRLGAMGVPHKILLKGQPVFLCCEGCESKARKKPDETLVKVKKLLEKRKGPASLNALAAPKPADDEDEAEIRAARDKLDPKDRELADAQDYCVILNDSRLGSMGKPVAIDLRGKRVLLCCKGCEAKARANPSLALSKQQELKAKKASGGRKPPVPPSHHDHAPANSQEGSSRD
jgi:hypothetical protein